MLVGVLLVPLAASCAATETVDTAWNLAAPAEGDVLEIVVAVGSSSCNALGEVEVTETDDSIDIRATVEVNDPGGCTDDLTTSMQAVELEEPVGSRVLTGCRPPDGSFTDVYERDVPTEGDCREAIDQPVEEPGS